MRIAKCKLQIAVAGRLGGRRRGLSTLEMVLCLPILLMLMALMINFGTRWCWKVRAHSVARHAVWGSRSPRRADHNPRPDYWPATANVTVESEVDAPELDDPRVHQPVARGPLPFGATVNQRLLDPTRQFRRGSAELDRHYPMLRKMGPYRLKSTVHLLDDKWQYRQMGLSNNRQRRIPVIYALAKAPQSLANAYVQAAQAILGAAFQPQLRPLDNDEEFLYYRGYAPDFHPSLKPRGRQGQRAFCTLDLKLAREYQEDLIDRIQGGVQTDDQGNSRKIPGVPEKMTRAFINLYQSVIDKLKSQSAPGPPPPLVAELEKKIEVLRQFLGTL